MGFALFPYMISFKEIKMHRNKKLNYDKFVGLRVSSSLYVMLEIIAKAKNKRVNDLLREVLETYALEEIM